MTGAAFDRPCVLASASPRRTEILSRAGIEHEVCAASSEMEDRFAASWSHLSPAEHAMRLASLKALLVAQKKRGQACVILAADTVADCDGEILGKPVDRHEARKMLHKMAGRGHDVLTGLAVLVLPEGRLWTALEVTTVNLREDPGTVIDDYVRAGLADGKAGAYGIQDPLIGPLIDSLDGALDNVVGLPLGRVQEIFGEVSKFLEGLKSKEED